MSHPRCSLETLCTGEMERVKRPRRQSGGLPREAIAWDIRGMSSNVLRSAFQLSPLLDKCLDNLTYTPGLIAQVIVTGRCRYDNRFSIVQWMSAIL